MSTNVTLPALGESVSEGTVSRWLKKVGDTVAADEPLLEVSTDKVDTEIPSPVAGVLLEIRVDVDETAPVGAVLAVIGEPNEAPATAPAAPEPAPAVEPEPEPVAAAPEPEPEPAAAAAPSAAPAPAGPASGTEVTLPALGESVSEGTVSRWLKQVGDHVDLDEALVEVSTDKVDTEIPSPVSGTILEIRVGVDETVPVGAVLAIVGDAAAASPAPAPTPAPAPQPAPEPVATQEPAPPAAPAPVEAPAPAAPAPAHAVQAPAAPAPQAANVVAPRRASDEEAVDSYVTPLVRKLAAQHAVDLATVTGTGVGGRIRKQDVIDAKQAPQPA
ncbi:MAG TPA: biotin/lipoyl-containing protein, partial [Propionibacteriaceae bacterium]